MDKKKGIKNRLLRRYPGSTLPLVMLAILMLLVIGMSVLGLGLRGRIFSTRTGEQLKARAAADAALTKAIHEMNLKLQAQPWSGSSLPSADAQLLENSDAQFSYNITGDKNNGYIVNATGQSGQITKTILSNLKLQGPFEYAIFTQTGFELKTSATVDWYNYDDDDSSMKIGTNAISGGAIELKNGSVVNGDIVVGYGSDPADVINRQSGAVVTGGMYSMSRSEELMPVTVPAWLEGMPTGGDIEESTTLHSSGKYGEIELGNNQTLTIDGSIILYVEEDIEMGNSAEIRINDSSPSVSLIIYLGGNLEGKNASGFNNLTEDPTRLKIYALDTCETLEFKNSSNFYGAIYAPQAEIEMKNSADIYGSIIAHSYEQKNSAQFNYDASLRDVSVDDECVQFVINRWREQ